MKLAYIEWIDACSPTDTGWMLEGNIKKFSKKEWLVKDMGFIFSETKTYITLVGGYTDEDDDYNPTFHRALNIPKRCIRKRIDLTAYVK